MSSYPKICVVTITYNHIHFIKECNAGVFNSRYWTLDIGRIDVEYICMLMRANQWTAVKRRFVNVSNSFRGYLDEKNAISYTSNIILELI